MLDAVLDSIQVITDTLDSASIMQILSLYLHLVVHVIQE